ncbi:MAG: hypothetical protein SF070_09755 [Gemmatimonadota bacterium]|nr:hypothetical protein [Gemmatimonadota bacterium]
MGWLRPGTGRPGRAPVSEEARRLRSVTWVVLLLALVVLSLIIAAIKGVLPRETLGSLFLIFLALMAGVTLLGLKARRQAVADRERESRSAMIILLAAQLGRQPDDTLARIASKGGPAGEAAAMVLAGRREPRRSVGTPAAWN